LNQIPKERERKKKGREEGWVEDMYISIALALVNLLFELKNGHIDGIFSEK